MSRTRVLANLGLSTVVAVLIGVTTVRAQSNTPWAPWTTVGSAGTVEQSDLDNVLLGWPASGAVSLRSGSGSVRIRYNVVAVAGLFQVGLFQGGGYTLTSRLRVHGAHERVLVSFKQYGLTTGATTTLLALDSDTAAFNVGVWQVVSVDTGCASPPALDFVNNSYFMDVEITDTNTRFRPSPSRVAGPGLAMISLSLSPGWSSFLCYGDPLK